MKVGILVVKGVERGRYARTCSLGGWAAIWWGEGLGLRNANPSSLLWVPDKADFLTVVMKPPSSCSYTSIVLLLSLMMLLVRFRYMSVFGFSLCVCIFIYIYIQNLVIGFLREGGSCGVGT